MVIHQKAMSDLKIQLKELTHPEQQECMERCISAVQVAIDNTQELKEKMIECVKLFYK